MMPIHLQQKPLHSEAMPDPTFVVIGRLAAPYGVKGWQHVDAFTDPLENILQYKTWYIGTPGDWKAYALQAGRLHTKRVVAHLAGIDSPETAALLTRKLIAVPRDEMPKLAPDQYYWADLEGMTVALADRTVVGQIDHLYDNAGTDVMVVVAEDAKNIHIPFIIDDTVICVNMDAKTVIIDWDIKRS